MNTEYRVILADGYIIAQFNQNTGLMQSASWYTCSKADNNDEGDFAVWPLSQSNLEKAHKLINGECKLIECPNNCHINQHRDNGWYIHRGDTVDDKAYGSHSEALRNLARSL